MIDIVYFIITILLIISYHSTEHKSYRASWRVHLIGILLSCFVLFLKDVNVYARYFIFSILMWHVIDIVALIYNNDINSVLEAYTN